MCVGQGLEDKLILATDGRCVCPGDTLTYECMVIGNQLGTTVWPGTAFDCANGEISLLHSAYTENSVLRAYDECNNGLTVALGADVADSVCYISQLNITVSVDMIGKSIECHYDDSNTTTSQLIGAANIITGKSSYTSECSILIPAYMM